MAENGVEVKVSFKNSVTQLKKLKEYREILNGINSVISGLDTQTVKSLENTNNFTKDTSKSIKDISQKVKIAFNYSVVKKFASALGSAYKSMVKYSTVASDYYENWNLFQVAFQSATSKEDTKEAIKQAKEFTDSLSKMFGLDESWALRTTGLFKQLANAMGLAEETGTKLSKLMTQMSLDISSLFNTSIERASSVLQSSLAGQTKPIRGLTGGDITQATLQTTLDNLGIDRAINELSYAEKRLVIVISLTQQLNEAIGDMGRTIESPANQSRVLASQWERLTRAIGNVFLPILAKILPYLNAIMMVLTEIINLFAVFVANTKLFKFDTSQFDVSGVKDTTGLIDEMADSLDGASESAKKLKQGLRGFDKLNNITTPSDTGKTGGAGGISADILNAFNDAYDLYQKKFGEVSMKATEIAKKLKDWLGITDGSYKNLKRILAVLGIIVGATILGKIIKFVKFLSTTQFSKSLLLGIELFAKNTLTLKSILGITSPTMGKFIAGFDKLAGLLGLTSPELAILIGVVTALGTAFIYAYEHNDKFKEKVNIMANEVSKRFGELYKVITDTFKSIWEVIEPLWKIVGDYIVYVVGYLYDKVVYWFTDIADTITGVCKIIKDLVEGDFDKAFEDLKIMVENWYKNWKDYHKKAQERFEEFSKKVTNNLDDFKTKFKEKMDNIVEKVKKMPEEFGKWVGEAVGKIIKIIAETDWKAEGQKILDGIVKGLTDFNSKLNDWGKKMGDKIREGIRNTDWSSIGKNILEGIYVGLNPLGAIGSSVLKKFGSGFITGLKESLGIHSPSKLVIDAKIGNYTLEGITEGMEKEFPKLKEEADNIVDMLNASFTKIEPLDDFYNSNSYSNLSNKYNPFNIGYDNQDANASNKGISQTQIYNINVGSEKIATVVLKDLKRIAKDNGKPIEIEA